MKGEEDDDKIYHLDKDTWEKNHFFLQLARIPKNNPELNLLRVLQISYNIGQLLAIKNKYSREGLEYFLTNKLENIESYINIDKCNYDKLILQNINEEIKKIISGDNDMMGGGQNENIYYNKYLKYKTKYLKLIAAYNLINH
jgi:hypothetical protein